MYTYVCVYIYLLQESFLKICSGAPANKVNIAHCNTLQYTATRCNTLQQTASHCNSLQHTAAVVPANALKYSIFVGRFPDLIKSSFDVFFRWQAAAFAVSEY